LAQRLRFPSLGVAAATARLSPKRCAARARAAPGWQRTLPFAELTPCDAHF
jgi:hypothetical protein